MTSVLEAQALLRQGRMQEAEDAYARALEITPDNIEALNVLAMASLNRGDATGALALLRRASGIDPTDAITQHHLARAHEAASDHANALVAHEQAVHLNPEFNLGRLYFAVALEQRGANRFAAPILGGAVESRAPGTCRACVGLRPGSSAAAPRWAGVALHAAVRSFESASRLYYGLPAWYARKRRAVYARCHLDGPGVRPPR